MRYVVNLIASRYHEEEALSSSYFHSIKGALFLGYFTD